MLTRDENASVAGDMSLPKATLASKTGWNAAASIFSIGGRMLVQVVLARTLGPEGVGRLACAVVGV